LRAFHRAFFLGRNGLDRPAIGLNRRASRLGRLFLFALPMLRFRYVGLVGDVIGNVVTVEAAKPDRRVLVD
jgi:hypothetical protein